MEDKIAIQLFEGNKVRVVWDEELEKYFFSIVDIIQVLTDCVDPKQYIKRLRARDSELNIRWGTIWTPTEMRAADEKKTSNRCVSVVCGGDKEIQVVINKKIPQKAYWSKKIRKILVYIKKNPYLCGKIER